MSVDGHPSRTSPSVDGEDKGPYVVLDIGEAPRYLLIRTLNDGLAEGRGNG